MIVDGGYAGMALLTVLSLYAQDTDITVIDPRKQHLKITHLHEIFRYTLSDLQVLFANLAKQFSKTIRPSIYSSRTTIEYGCAATTANKKYLVLNEEILHFDYLLITPGCGNRNFDPIENVISLQDFMTVSGSDRLRKQLVQQGNEFEQTISI